VNDSVQLADCAVYNNVVYSTHAPAIQFEPMSANKNFLFVNNIFIGNGPVVHGPSSGEKFMGNIWWKPGQDITFRDHRDLVEWSAATGQERLNGQIAGRQIDQTLKALYYYHYGSLSLRSLTGYSLMTESP
jgi:hypothetical protein